MSFYRSYVNSVIIPIILFPLVLFECNSEAVEFSFYKELNKKLILFRWQQKTLIFQIFVSFGSFIRIVKLNMKHINNGSQLRPNKLPEDFRIRN